MKFSHSAFAALLVLSPMFAGAADSSKQSASVSAHSEEIDLRVLLREVSARMHKHFAVDPHAPQTIDLCGMDHQEITYPQLLSVLHVYGLAVVTDGTVMQVLPNIDIRQAPLPIVAPDNIKTLDDEYVTAIVPIKNISAVQIVSILHPLVPSYGHLAALQDRNAVIIVDRTANVRRIVEMINILEKLPKAAEPPPAKTP
jgi:general secretion pathway protein D